MGAAAAALMTRGCKRKPGTDFFCLFFFRGGGREGMENRLGDILQAGMIQCGKTFFFFLQLTSIKG